jgi:hypothetical protein
VFVFYIVIRVVQDISNNSSIQSGTIILFINAVDKAVWLANCVPSSGYTYLKISVQLV